jgi:hypothetical protein
VEKKQQGETGFVPVKAWWIIDITNSWMERCKSLTKKIDAKLMRTHRKSYSQD